MPIPFELQPSEQAFFPAPFVPTEQHRLVITNKRLVRFSDAGPFPIGEVPVDTIEFAGRQTERPYVGLAVVMGLLGLLLIIGGLWKVLPPALSAGKTEAPGKEEVIDTGRTADDNFPAELDSQDPKKKLKAGADKLQKLKEIKVGVPQLTTDVVLGGLMVLLGAGAAFGARAAFRRRRHLVYCTAAGAVQPIPVESEQQQMMVLGAIQTAMQIAKTTKT